MQSLLSLSGKRRGLLQHWKQLHFQVRIEQVALLNAIQPNEVLDCPGIPNMRAVEHSNSLWVHACIYELFGLS